MTTYLNEVWIILVELSPALLAGLLLAGALHVMLPAGFIHKTMNRPGFRSTLRAVLFGVPLPLCSCGVVPTALGLKREGASNGATTGFLISTPQTGVDSIMVSAAFLGWPFAIFKLAAAFVTGLIGGMITDRVVPVPAQENIQSSGPSQPKDEARQRHVVEILRYAVFDLYAVIDRWIILGVLAAAAISVLLPGNFFEELSWAQGLTGMLLMLAVAIPLYICTTASVPIAASFVVAGMPTGTALVFLMAGPATNIATIGAVYRTLGARVLAVYLGTVIIMSIGFGLTFDFVLGGMAPPPIHEHGTDGLGAVSALIVIALTIGLFFHRQVQRKRRASMKKFEEVDVGLTLKVEGMTCQHCVANVKKSLETIAGVEEALPDLDTGEVIVHGDDLDLRTLKTVVETAGYSIRD